MGEQHVRLTSYINNGPGMCMLEGPQCFLSNDAERPNITTAKLEMHDEQRFL